MEQSMLLSSGLSNLGRMVAFAIGATLTAPAFCGILLVDDFVGDTLDPHWTLHRGYTNVHDGFLELYGSTPGTRDGYVYTALADPSWTDYHLTSRFILDGGGNNWYLTSLTFRVQSAGYWSWGNYYGFGIRSPLYGSNEGAAWWFDRADDVGGTPVVHNLAGGPLDPAVVPINDRDNKVDVFAAGNQFRFLINGYSLTPVPITDPYPNPHLYGEVGLQTIWESHTRFDYVSVMTLPAPVPEPAASAMMMAGLGLLGLGVARRRATVGKQT